MCACVCAHERESAGEPSSQSAARESVRGCEVQSLWLCLCACVCSRACVCESVRNRERERERETVPRRSSAAGSRLTIHPAALLRLCLDSNTTTTTGDSEDFWGREKKKKKSTCACVKCVSRTALFGRQGARRMSSADQGSAGGHHGLPSLASLVRAQPAVSHPESGHDERTLDRMGADQWTDLRREKGSGGAAEAVF